MRALGRAPDAAHAAAWGDKPPARLAKILSFREYRNPAGTMLGYLDVELPSGMRLYGCKLMVGSKGTRWIATPNLIRRNPDGQPVTNDDGKLIWDPVVDFRDSSARAKFRDVVIAALKAKHPELFAGDAP
jgi:hypothetical protein